MTTTTHRWKQCKHCGEKEMKIIRRRIRCEGCDTILGDVEWSASVVEKPPDSVYETN